MADLLTSEAAFKEHAEACGLSETNLTALTGQGLKTLSGLAYCLTVPGSPPAEDAIRKLLDPANPASVNLASVDALRRLIFEAQTLAVAFVKTALDGANERCQELAPAERDSRITAQKGRLKGMNLTGFLECGYSCYTMVQELIDANAVIYLDPQKMITRSQEVGKEKKGKELILVQESKLSVRDPVSRERCAIQNELQLFQALQRRSLALDLMHVASYEVSEQWHQYLMDRMLQPAPPGFRKPTIEQILRADKQAWLRMSESCKSIKALADGSLPMDGALKALTADPTVLFHLLPLPLGGGGSKEPAENPKGRGRGKGGQKRKSDNREPSSSSNLADRLPEELKNIPNLKFKTAKNKNKCWGFNCKKCHFSKPGGMCRRGVHVCLLCDAEHAVLECPKRPKE